MPGGRLQRIQDQVISGLTISLLTASVGFLWNISTAITSVSKELALVAQTTAYNSSELKLHSQTLVDYGNRITRLETDNTQDKPRRK